MAIRSMKIEPLTDLSPMPFGVHRGVPMQDVPAHYLHWFWREGNRHTESGKAVCEYIKKSLSALKDENEDLIW
jgi:uncharacterized protein (DUF3820 family)